MIRSLKELLAATGRAGLGDLEERVDEYVDMDGNLEVEANGVTLILGRTYVKDLLYPFTFQQFWEALDELEAWQVEEDEDG